MIQFAHRLKNIQEYYFSKKLKEVRQLITQGKPIINMGIGSPDFRPPEAATEALQQSLYDTNAHVYQSYQGLPEFREAIANFYKNSYDVTLDTTSEILPMMGSKEGILHISLAVLNANDQVLIPNPGYPTYASVTKLVGATPVFYDVLATTDYQPNFEALEQTDLSKVKLMWVSYPHMPTGAKASKSTFEKLITFGKKHNILIVNDNPYSFILNESPQSILEIEGAKDIALELNSLSKTFNMAGWRVGMLLGNKYFISEILKVKTQQDSGMFYGVQKAAIAALKTSKEWIEQQNLAYNKRRLLVWKLADNLNCTYSRDSAGLFVWAKLPEGKTSEKVIDTLLLEKHIFAAPGTIFGTNGEGYIRFSLCVSEHDIKEALKRVSL